MKDDIFFDIPAAYQAIAEATKALNFTMASDMYTGSLLKTLVASKRGGRFLELGTGSGLATSWMISGMDQNATLTTVENNDLLLEIAKQQLANDQVEFVFADCYEWIQNYTGDLFDLIFADAMPGKYDLFEETFAIVATGGLYVIDDMLPQPNWPEGHAARVGAFIAMLEKRTDLVLTKLAWSTGIIIVTKVAHT